MKPEALLADLSRLGFVLQSCDGGIRVTPSSKLTPSQRKSILDNKSQLQLLLAKADAGCSPGAVRQVEAPKAVKRPPAPLVLCLSCRPRGKPVCVPCILAFDPSLEVAEYGYQFQVRPKAPPFSAAEVLCCDECGRSYEGLRPGGGLCRCVACRKVEGVLRPCRCERLFVAKRSLQTCDYCRPVKR